MLLIARSLLYSPLSIDVDECERGLALCQGEAQCRDTDGAYECVCGEGLRVSEDGLSCDGKLITRPAIAAYVSIYNRNHSSNLYRPLHGVYKLLIAPLSCGRYQRVPKWISLQSWMCQHSWILQMCVPAWIHLINGVREHLCW